MRPAIKTFLAAATVSLLAPGLPLAADGSGVDIVARMNAEAANAVKRSQVVVWVDAFLQHRSSTRDPEILISRDSGLFQV